MEIRRSPSGDTIGNLAFDALVGVYTKVYEGANVTDLSTFQEPLGGVKYPTADWVIPAGVEFEVFGGLNVRNCSNPFAGTLFLDVLLSNGVWDTTAGFLNFTGQFSQMAVLRNVHSAGLPVSDARLRIATGDAAGILISATAFVRIKARIPL